MTKKTLLIISGIADSVDLVTGWIPGPWSFIVDVPVTIAHFVYAGPKAFVVLLEYVPVVGVAPIYTLAAMSYPDKDSVGTRVTVPPPLSHDGAVIDVEIIPTRANSTRTLPPVPNASAARTDARTPGQRLQQITQYRNDGLITEAEFEAKKAEILEAI